MIGYNRLGINGRFGNQLFQYASLRGIANKHGYDWCIPEDSCRTANYGIHHPFKLKHLKNISEVSYSSRFEDHFHFDEKLFETCPDNINLDGYLQSEKYFKHIESEIREDFEFIDDILNPCKEFIDEFEKIIFLHVRRGDNVGREHLHPIPSMKYYEQALTYFEDDCYVFVATDDVEWCKEQEFFSSEKFLLNEDIQQYSHECMEGNGEYKKSFIPYVDLCLMSLCNGAIISPSTLSWWGAWLQKNRTNPVIAPDPWFGPQLLKDNNTKDLLPDSWIKLQY
jgi:hypothetical protein